VETAAVTAASICAVLATLVGAGRWAHRWFSSLERVISVVEHRSQQLVPDHGQSLRDDVAAIRTAVDAHGRAISELQAAVAAMPGSGTGAGQ
jgi:hypothetical protein